MLSEIEALDRLKEVLSDLFESSPVMHPLSGGVDAVMHVASYRFAIELKLNSGSQSIKSGIERLHRWSKEGHSNDIPLLVVPYMSELGKRQCESSRVSWVDLSGNARIVDRALFVRTVGFPNNYKEKRRPRNPFAPKSSRILRVLLTNPEKAYSQTVLAQETRLSKAMVSQVITTLTEDGHVSRSKRGVELCDPGLLLQEWKHRYSLSDSKIIKGHVYSGSDNGMVLKIGEKLSGLGICCAFTGLAAAWYYARFSGFRLATVYADRSLSMDEFNELGFKKEPRGANLWIVEPKDSGVFWQSDDASGVRFVSPIQTYLDLEGHPERSKEAQEELQKECLAWSLHAI